MMRHQRRTSTTATTTTTIKERVQCKKSLKLKGNNIPSVPRTPWQWQEMLNSFVSTYHLHKRQHNRKDIEAAQGVKKRRLKQECALRKRIKNVIMSTRKKPERERERSELEIIAECQIGLYTYDMYDSPRYLRVYRLFFLDLYSRANQITTWQLLELVGGRGCLSHLLGIKLRPQKIELYFMRFITIYTLCLQEIHFCFASQACVRE